MEKLQKPVRASPQQIIKAGRMQLLIVAIVI